ncbi:MAG: hypothetical protein B7Y45_10970 [Sphingomonas sp. 28-66-16]|nr:MAG: hypothetical protein B7Y45_10970 [Sphingomonas sp. 28-66-16]
MPFDRASFAHMGASWTTIAGLAEADGSGNHATVLALGKPQAAARDIADAVHLLCMLHGHLPGVLDHAAGRNRLPAAQGWLEESVEAFAIERALLARLASAAGPLPSTPGQAESEATVVAQRHALEMLSQSDRTGCAIGGAVALVVDWEAIRTVLDTAADRFGFTAPAARLPHLAETATLVAAAADTPAAERAMAFGAQQVLAQHRGLWNLLDARASARNQN